MHCMLSACPAIALIYATVRFVSEEHRSSHGSKASGAGGRALFLPQLRSPARNARWIHVCSRCRSSGSGARRHSRLYSQFAGSSEQSKPCIGVEPKFSVQGVSANSLHNPTWPFRHIRSASLLGICYAWLVTADHCFSLRPRRGRATISPLACDVAKLLRHERDAGKRN